MFTDDIILILQKPPSTYILHPINHSLFRQLIGMGNSIHCFNESYQRYQIPHKTLIDLLLSDTTSDYILTKRNYF